MAESVSAQDCVWNWARSQPNAGCHIKSSSSLPLVHFQLQMASVEYINKWHWSQHQQLILKRCPLIYRDTYQFIIILDFKEYTSIKLKKCWAHRKATMYLKGVNFCHNFCYIGANFPNFMITFPDIFNKGSFQRKLSESASTFIIMNMIGPWFSFE